MPLFSGVEQLHHLTSDEGGTLHGTQACTCIEHRSENYKTIRSTEIILHGPRLDKASLNIILKVIDKSKSKIHKNQIHNGMTSYPGEWLKLKHANDGWRRYGEIRAFYFV